MKDAYTETAKKMYIAGNSDSAIAGALNVTVRTIQNWRKKSLANGDDWAAQKLAAAMTKEDIDQREKEFLAALITNFEGVFDKLQAPIASTDEAAKRLELLNKYARFYWQLKAPVKKEDRSRIVTAITETIKTVADLAIEQDESAVALWLSAQADEVISRILRK